MELRHLEHFLAVAEEQNFTRAAKRVHLVQSALSASIRVLERDVGAVLFERSTHQVRLTEAGEALLPEARRILLGVAAAYDAVAAKTTVVRGNLRLGVMQSLALTNAAELLSEFHRLHPEVIIEPRTATGGSTALAEQVRDGRLDVALAWPSQDAAHGLQVVPLATEPLALIDQPGRRQFGRQAVAVRDLEGERFVDYPAGWGTRGATDLAFAGAGVERVVAVEVADALTCIELVRAGFGMAFVPASLLVHARGLTTHPIKDPPLWGIALALPGNRPPSAAARALAGLITARSGRLSLRSTSQRK